MSESLLGRIFISYRRQETAWPAGRLYDVLVEHFAAEQVFKDVDNIEPGEDFVERITAAVGFCDVLLVLIGPQWLTITDENGQRRLDNPEDYVRLEIEAALKRKIRVIPILVDDAPMPRANQLPASLAALVRRNAVEINPLTFDTKRLMTTVHKTLAELKVPDTSPGSESPTSTPRPDRSNQQVAEPDMEELYDRALAAFWTERWEKAVDLLGQVVSQQPDYPDAARKLELARRQQQLAIHYARASAATDTGDWDQAIAEYTMITATDPGYRDTNSRLANARHQQQLATLQAEADRLHRAGQWAAVIKVGEQLQAIDPAVADPEGLMASARAQLAAEQRAAKLAADYHTALHLFDAGQWKEAADALEQVIRLDSTYQDAPALLDRARQELGQASDAFADEQSQPKAESAGDQPRADQNKSPDKESRGTQISVRVLAIVSAIGLVVIVMVQVFGSKEILFEDFSSRVNGWDDAGSAIAGGHYTNDAYRIHAEPTGEDHVEAGAPRNASNVYPTAPRNLTIDVDVKPLALPERSTVYGVACRYGKNGNRTYRYAFNVGPDYVQIAKHGVDGDYREITSKAPPTGFNVNGTNNLRAECSNDEGNQAVHLVFYVNDSRAAEGIDSDNPLPAGTVALFAQSFKNAEKAVEAEFDQLSVSSWR